MVAINYKGLGITCLRTTWSFGKSSVHFFLQNHYFWTITVSAKHKQEYFLRHNILMILSSLIGMLENINKKSNSPWVPWNTILSKIVNFQHRYPNLKMWLTSDESSFYKRKWEGLIISNWPKAPPPSSHWSRNIITLGQLVSNSIRDYILFFYNMSPSVRCERDEAWWCQRKELCNCATSYLWFVRLASVWHDWCMSMRADYTYVITGTLFKTDDIWRQSGHLTSLYFVLNVWRHGQAKSTV